MHWHLELKRTREFTHQLGISDRRWRRERARNARVLSTVRKRDKIKMRRMKMFTRMCSRWRLISMCRWLIIDNNGTINCFCLLFLEKQHCSLSILHTQTRTHIHVCSLILISIFAMMRKSRWSRSVLVVQHMHTRNELSIELNYFNNVDRCRVKWKQN